VGFRDDRGMIDASLKGRLRPVGFEESLGEPVGNLELLGELSRRPFASRPTRIEVLRVQALPGGEARHHVTEHAVVVREVVGGVYRAAGQIADAEALGDDVGRSDAEELRPDDDRIGVVLGIADVSPGL
jgi:hypothetical protein